jgi:hypothetical protein
MLNQSHSTALLCRYRKGRFPSGELLKETKLLFNHQGSDAELVKQIAIAVQAISTLK